MKFNWGHGIIVAFIAFMSFILYFVIKINTNKAYSHDLVTKDYYKKELEVQDDIDAIKRAKKANYQLDIKRSSEGLTIGFPENIESEKIQGDVFLYRPSDKRLDFNIPIVISKPHLLVPKSRLLGGRWNILVKWTYDGQQYLHRENLRL